MIAPVVGPEGITGSTRLKAGTAPKRVLNMLTTGAVVRIGKTFGNLMVDLTASNEKLRDRSQRIVSDLTGLSSEAAQKLLSECSHQVKTAIVVHHRKLTPEAAREQLKQCNGHLRNALQQ